MNSHVTLLVDEEYGYRSWICKTNLTWEELAKMWREIQTACCLHNIPKMFSDLGEWREGDFGELADLVSEAKLSKDPLVAFAHYHEDDDTYLLNLGTNKRVYHKGYEKYVG